MKSIIKKTGLFWIILSVLIINFCKKEEVPVLTTSAITNIINNSATSGGTITSEGIGTVIARGVCWSTNIKPTITDNKTSDGAGTGTFISNITGLNGSTTYYVRAYATNSAGTGYGMVLSFEIPLCKTCQQNQYDSNGNLLTTGSSTVYCGSWLLQIESLPDVIVNGIKTKWVCK
jgi:hypothetical protein